MSQFDQIYDRRGTGSVKYDLLEAEGWSEDTLPLWVADMDFPAPACAGEALRELSRPGIFGYSFPDEQYQAAVTGWFARRFGWKPQREWLVETPGVVFALCTAVRAFTQPGDAVACLPPVYPHFFEAASDNGRRPVYSPLKQVEGRYEIDFDGLAALLEREKPKLLILCSPHNPAGRVWTRAELERLGRLCLEHGVIVAADEIHCDFTYPGHPHTPYLSLGEDFAARAIACTAPSKTFNLAGLQCSNVWIPDQGLRRAFRRELTAQGVSGVNAAGRAACRAVYEQGEGWLEELLVYLRGNYEFLKAFLERELPELKVSPLEGTYLAWVDARGLGLDQQGLDSLLRRARVWFNDGAGFGPGGEGFWRVNLACPRSVLTQALERIRDAVSTAK